LLVVTWKMIIRICD